MDTCKPNKLSHAQAVLDCAIYNIKLGEPCCVPFIPRRSKKVGKIESTLLEEMGELNSTLSNGENLN